MQGFNIYVQKAARIKNRVAFNEESILHLLDFQG